MKFLKVFLLIVAFLALLTLINSQKKTKDKTTVEIEPKEEVIQLTQAEKDSIEHENLKFLIELEINRIKNDEISYDNFRGDGSNLNQEIILFRSWWKLIEEGKNDNLKELSASLEKKVKAIQIREFPIIRKEYFKKVKSKLWVKDIDVKLSGKRNDKLMLIGSLFAANKNKKDLQNNIHEVLKKFRFKRSSYKWYAQEDEYTYWEVYKGKDSDVVQ